MDRRWGRFKDFWGAEEIPRSIGMLLVLVYLSALGAIGVSAHRRVSEFAHTEVKKSTEDALCTLADAIEPPSASSTGQSPDVLHRFAHTYNCVQLHVYDRKLKVLASLSPVDVGQPLPKADSALPLTPKRLESVVTPATAGRAELLLARVPLHGSGQPATHFIEGVFELELPQALSGVLNLWTLLIALACTGAFLLVYRRLRRHFRSFSQISDRLVSNADCLGQQLPELRLPNAHDELGNCWNRLIDLTISLEEDVARSTASSELLAALDRNKVGELAEAMTSVPLGVVLTTEHGQVMYSNAMASRLIGWARDADVARSLDDEDLTADGQQIVERIRACLGDSGPYRMRDIQITGSDGSYYYTQIIPVRTRQQSSRLVVLILDVSQQVRADKAREEFVSQVTHELRTPLTNIRAYAETLSSGMFDDPTVVAECYNVITKETRRLSRLIEDILSISQLEVGTMQLVLDDVDLRPLLSEAVRDVRGIAESKNIDLQLSLPPKLEKLHADRDKLTVVVNNLLGNALKYTPDGGQVTVSCKTDDGRMLLSIRDNGIGIDSQDHGRIFEKFQRSDDETVQAETGTGIGLTTAREIIRQHGGDITMVSKKGEGSTFNVSVPLQEQPAVVEVAG